MPIVVLLSVLLHLVHGNNTLISRCYGVVVWSDAWDSLRVSQRLAKRHCRNPSTPPSFSFSPLHPWSRMPILERIYNNPPPLPLPFTSLSQDRPLATDKSALPSYLPWPPGPHDSTNTVHDVPTREREKKCSEPRDSAGISLLCRSMFAFSFLSSSFLVFIFVWR